MAKPRDLVAYLLSCRSHSLQVTLERSCIETSGTWHVKMEVLKGFTGESAGSLLCSYRHPDCQTRGAEPMAASKETEPENGKER